MLYVNYLCLFNSSSSFDLILVSGKQATKFVVHLELYRLGDDGRNSAAYESYTYTSAVCTVKIQTLVTVTTGGVLCIWLREARSQI